MKDNKKINRIITFGCSNTYGESLPDVAGKYVDLISSICLKFILSEDSTIW